MKHIIVNADDFGADAYRNQGIAEAVDAGVVTSVSVLVNGPAFEDALDRLAAWQRQGISIGLHVNLSEGCPVGKGLVVLSGEDGCFQGKSSTHKLLMQKGNQELKREVAREIEAQIGILAAKGIRISHLDGHQHVHLFPAAIAAAVRAAQGHGITWLRIPEETAPGGKKSLFQDDHSWSAELADRGEANSDPGEGLSREAARFSRLARGARPFLKGSGIRATDHFRGLYAKGRLSLACLEELLSTLPSGLTELMVHPGRSPAGKVTGPFASFSNMDREGELDVLLDPRLGDIFKGKGAVLTPFPEARS